MISRIILSGILVLGFLKIIQAGNSKSTMLKSANLTTIKWEHAVNSKDLLQKALANTHIQMLEADVVVGNLFNEKNKTLPVMAHPPLNESDLSLEMFLKLVHEHNTKNPTSNLGVKLDFKSIEAYENSTEILKSYHKMFKSFWLNADILKGPGNSNSTPVDAAKFLSKAKDLQGFVTLSIGWTTNWTKTMGNLKYEKIQVQEMLKVITDNKIENTNITYPVRAVFAENSINELNSLLSNTEGMNKNNATLTIWSSKDEKVDAKKLKDVINKIGVHRIYLDVPTELEKQLHLNSSGLLKSSVFNIILISIIAIFLSGYLKQ